MARAFGGDSSRRPARMSLMSDSLIRVCEASSAQVKPRIRRSSSKAGRCSRRPVRGLAMRRVSAKICEVSMCSANYGRSAISPLVTRTVRASSGLVMTYW